MATYFADIFSHFLCLPVYDMGLHVYYRQFNTSNWAMVTKDWTTGLSGPRLNIKTVLSTYGDFHVKDKTAVRTSYL